MQEGLTALILATQKGHSDMITALANAKADPDIMEKVTIELDCYGDDHCALTYHYAEHQLERNILCFQRGKP